MSFAADFEWSAPTADDAGPTRFTIRVPADLKYFDGHFVGDPIVPGVAQIVALAEEGARRAFPELGANAGLRRVKFMEALRPNDTLELAVERSDKGVGFVVLKQGREASRGTLLFR
jgi:3-hydroxymyristoyl/3-hydroxydecanoyl-(acyl carrier protein) dehydratase